jgi:hypothetical protein
MAEDSGDTEHLIPTSHEPGGYLDLGLFLYTYANHCVLRTPEKKCGDPHLLIHHLSSCPK